jgi:solute carrier family 13 (sodium-dependent dicarboxylate transporter), member 2/3/5
MTRQSRDLMLGALVATTVVVVLLAFHVPWKPSITLGITSLCAIWWILEPLPIPATSLIPFAAFPLVGVVNEKLVSRAYGHPLILLLLGGFILSTAVEKSGVHRRLAWGMVRLVGGGGKRLVLGFMVATAACSMWISNTATVLMMLPVAQAALESTKSDSEQDSRQDSQQASHEPLTSAMLLGLAYAASIGGMGTPVGTPPNVIFLGVYREVTGIDIGFLGWMELAVPIVVVFLPLVWLWLTRKIPVAKAQKAPAVPKLGPWRPEEKRVLAIFAGTAVLWITRTAPWGGWPHLVGIKGIGDSTIALAAIVLLFLVPNGREHRLLDWETANQIPWGHLLLFGGGIAIAQAFESSGLSPMLGRKLEVVAHWPLLVMIGALCLAVTFLTEVTSNTATTTLLMPILAVTATSAHLDPMLLMAPAALSASCAFMLPVATAPNAIVFATQKLSVKQMVREGFVLNLIGVVVVTFLSWFVLQ